MKRICNVTDDLDGKKFDSALQVLESPDPNSKTKTFNGRRIERVEGGWMILNHEEYRLHEDIIREQNRQRVKKYRETQRLIKDVTLRNVTSTLHSVSESVSVSKSLSQEVGCKGGERKKPEPKKFIPPSLDDVLKYFSVNEYTADAAKRFYDYYVVGDWRDAQGTQVLSWKQKAIAVWFKPENKLKLSREESYQRYLARQAEKEKTEKQEIAEEKRAATNQLRSGTGVESIGDILKGTIQ
jgi:hypothetical protein